MQVNAHGMNSPQRHHPRLIKLLTQLCGSREIRSEDPFHHRPFLGGERSWREAASTSWRHDGHVFTTAQGRPIDPTNLTFVALLRKAGLRRIRFHDLRHSTATLHLEQGVHLVIIKALLGHAHVGVTATVDAHVRPRLQRQAIDTLSDALGEGDDSEEPPPSAVVVR